MRQRAYGGAVLIGLVLLGVFWWMSRPRDVESRVSPMRDAWAASAVAATATTTAADKPPRAASAGAHRPGNGGNPGFHPEFDTLQPCDDDYRGAIRRELQSLRAKPDARSQLTAALLAPMETPNDAQSAALMAEKAWDAAATAGYAAAGRLDPDDVLAAWLEAVGCPKAAQNCGRDAAHERLQRLEPDNAAVWLLALDDAQERDDQAAVDRYLRLAAETERYDIHWGEVGQLLDAALQQVPVPACRIAGAEAEWERLGMNGPPGERDLATHYAAGIGMAIALPAHAGLAAACGVNHGMPPAPARTQACVAVLSRLADSPELISQLIGLVQLVRLTADVPEGVHWRERLRALRWLQERASPLVANVPADYVRSVWRDGEVEAMKTLLVSAAQPTTPPSGWLPDDARGRALITTGRPPPGG